MATKKGSRVLKERPASNKSKQELEELSQEIKTDNTRVIGFGTFTVPENFRRSRKNKTIEIPSYVQPKIEKSVSFGQGKKAASLGGILNKKESVDDFKERLYKNWVKHTKGQQTGDLKPLDSRESFDLYFDVFRQFVKEQELKYRETEFRKFLKETKGKKGREAITALKGCLRWAVGQSPKITAGQLITFLSVAENEHQTLAHYCDVTRQQKSTISRHMLEMGGTTEKYVGLDWIKMEDHPTDGRAKLFSLTEKGQQFIAHIEEQMSMPYEESNLLSSVLGVPIPTKGVFNITSKATVLTKANREREAKVTKKQAEVAEKYNFLNN